MGYMSITGKAVSDYVVGDIMSTLFVLGIAFIIFFVLAVYIYFSLAWMTIAKKVNYKRPWLAWIPIANIAMIIHIAGYHWAIIFGLLIPLVGWIGVGIIVIMATWKIFEMRRYPGWLSLAAIIPKGAGFVLSLIVIGFVAWVDKPGTKRTSGKRKKNVRKKSYSSL